MPDLLGFTRALHQILVRPKIAARNIGLSWALTWASLAAFAGDR